MVCVLGVVPLTLRAQSLGTSAVAALSSPDRAAQTGGGDFDGDNGGQGGGRGGGGRGDGGR